MQRMDLELDLRSELSSSSQFKIHNECLNEEDAAAAAAVPASHQLPWLSFRSVCSPFCGREVVDDDSS